MAKPSPAWNFCSGAFFPWLSWMKPPFTPIWTWDRETTPIQQVRLDIRGPWDAATDVEGLDKASLTEGVDIRNARRRFAREEPSMCEGYP